MNGAETLLRTLLNSGVDTCFANPGTSEMHFVAALDRVPGMRPVLGLFEGVVAGAADGYARMADKPAATLFHLGPGLGNGLSQLHNAMKARTPIVNVVGEHATWHRQYDTPLASDVAAYARPVSGWLRTCASSRLLAADTRAAVDAAYGPPGQIASLILPADCSWNEAGEPAPALEAPRRAPVDATVLDHLEKVLRSGEPVVVLMNGAAVRADGLEAASRLANATGAQVFADTFTPRLQRGAGRSPVERFPRYPDQGQALLREAGHLILVETVPPVGFFAYPEQPSWLTPDSCHIHTLAAPGEDSIGALQQLCDRLGAAADGATVQESSVPQPASGALTPQTVGQSIAAHLPEGAIISDEAVTSRGGLPEATAGCPPHDWLSLTGGALGGGLPMGIGAAVACPDRKVVCLQADGAGMYNVQSLWTMARERLDITIVVYANRSYRILHNEFDRLGLGEVGASARALMDIGNPDLDWTSLARGMGLEAHRIESIDAFNTRFAAAMREPGPRLLEVVL
ncbi:acetolactate synthase large subunit [Aquisalimonas sp. 2447]|uniref:acetolactate synthase large subunit n=1 Tax=Aquisalimonas sp. 2447 TaxID=2740807 RepID=UPI00143242FF|nr:acetolactate synthase large subunit [Aquisalimonas sp. 2447]QIT56198.1 acetolactate synthase large subunit [Aquisalimonas sp. 2447]